jgi:hypothetical protein
MIETPKWELNDSRIYTVSLLTSIRVEDYRKWLGNEWWVIMITEELRLSGFHCLLPASCWFVAWHTFQPWRWRQYVTPKRRLTSIGLPQHILLFRIISIIYSHPTNIGLIQAVSEVSSQLAHTRRPIGEWLK